MPAAQSILMKLMLSISKMDSVADPARLWPQTHPEESSVPRAGCPCPSPAEHMWLYALVPDPKQSGLGPASCWWCPLSVDVKINDLHKILIWHRELRGREGGRTRARDCR